MTPQNQTTTPTLSPSQMAKAFAALQQENKLLKEKQEALKAAAEAKQHFTVKVGAKGGVSVYGLGRFPVTLYAGQWERLIANSNKITVFMEEHKAELASKD